MTIHVEAMYLDGVLRPKGPLALPEGATVFVSIEAPTPGGDAVTEVSDQDFERILDAASVPGEEYEGTYSRADIYADHD